ncbi:unnamed protein product [Effrenium voratum]|uniref:Uncharacterized protein n=1 Tax=Effrenium voratum TaxID=2562239 RepID=A0AA36ILA0_9DINO|nr:unnamed protein product [Effrenium voratum]CAJ1389694.1 unnamed protein product [Effrenium voratum]CAJ1440890.1 unnamed protein product [Effrenium voratum]
MTDVPSEAIPALVAGAVGLVAAAVFVFSGASSQPTTWDKEKAADGAEEPLARETQESQDEDASGEKQEETSEAKKDQPKPTEILKPRPGRLTPDQEAKFRQGLANLPPESRKALEEWVNMTDNNAWELLGLNCLLLVFVAGLITLALAAVVGYWQVNIFSIDVWREGFAKLQIASQTGAWPRAQAREVAHELFQGSAEL